MKTIKVVIIRYKPIFVKDICMLPKMSPFTLKRFLIVNWSKGLWFQNSILLNKSKNKKKNTVYGKCIHSKLSIIK